MNKCLIYILKYRSLLLFYPVYANELWEQSSVSNSSATWWNTYGDYY